MRWSALLPAGAVLALASLVSLACGGNAVEEPAVLPAVADAPTRGVSQVVLPTPPWEPATPWPTFTPIPTPWPTQPFVDFQFEGTTSGSSDADGPEAGGGPTPALQLECSLHFRKWLLPKGAIRSGRQVSEMIDDFRRVRPDCRLGKFDPLISDDAICGNEDRVAGIKVSGELSLGKAYNHNVRLAGTKSDGSGNVLIHFLRMPTGRNSGCWYYSSGARRWHEEVYAVAEPVNTPAPTLAPAPVRAPTPLPAGYRECDAELRSLYAAEQGSVSAAQVNRLALFVETGLGQCSTGWKPLAAPAQVGPACPVEATGRMYDGRQVIHWESPPHDGAMCWLYEPATDQWESR